MAAPDRVHTLGELAAMNRTRRIEACRTAGGVESRPMSSDPLRAICLREGVFLRHEALSLGYDDGVLRRSLKAGVLTRVRHGAYTFSDLWDRSGAAERHVLLLRAVMRAHPDKVAASHHSAALLHGMDLWRVPLDRAHVTRLDGSSGRSHPDSAHHQGVILDADLTTVDSLRVVQPSRAALESASLLSVESGLVLLDSGLRLGLFSPPELENQLERMTAWPDSLHLQLVTRLADGRSGSVGETRSRHLFWSQGLPAPELQYKVYDARGLVGIADFCWPDHGLLGEFDGKMKYERYLRAGESPGDAVFREKQREDRLRLATGWRVVRLTWSMLDRTEDTASYLRSLMRVAS